MRMLIVSLAIVVLAVPVYADGEPSPTPPSTSNVISTQATKAITDATAEAAKKVMQETEQKDPAIKKGHDKKAPAEKK